MYYGANHWSPQAEPKDNSPVILSVPCSHSTWNCIQVSISNAWHNILLMTEGNAVIKWERLTYIRKLTDSKLLSVSKYDILSWGDGSVEKVFAEQPHRLKCEFQHPPKIQTGYEVERGRKQSVSSNSQLWPNRCYLKNTVGSDRRIPEPPASNHILRHAWKHAHMHIHVRLYMFCIGFLVLMGIEPSNLVCE